jgi:hypothetical protein
MTTILFWGAVVVGVSVLLAIIGQAVVHRLIPFTIRQANTGATGAIYAALYVMFGVSLAFSLFLVSSSFRDAQRTVESEVGNLEDIYRVAGQLPEPAGTRIQELVESYARVVVEEEWPLMGLGAESRQSPQAKALSEELTLSIEDFEASTNLEQALHAQLITLADKLGDNRELRLLESRYGVPSILWTVLVIGGTLTVGFTFLFGIEPPWFHRVAVGALTVVIVLLLYAIYRIEYPFTGVTGVRVEPEAFERLLEEISGRGGP